ncbi:hypothetical protein HYT25_02100 [Candidatus Pacearchaeota archaeon]|nr:hypothetical protein [Candidatus Pacearchaeota archaeon]
MTKENRLRLNVRFKRNKEANYLRDSLISHLPTERFVYCDAITMSIGSPYFIETKENAARFLLRNWIYESHFDNDEMNKIYPDFIPGNIEGRTKLAKNIPQNLIDRVVGETFIGRGYGMFKHIPLRDVWNIYVNANRFNEIFRYKDWEGFKELMKEKRHLWEDAILP